MRRCYGLTVTTRPRTRVQRRPIRSRMFDHGARPSATTSRRVSLLLQYLFGPMRLTDTVKKGTTMVISTLNFLLTRGVLRRGDGLVSTPDASAAAPSGSLGRAVLAACRWHPRVSSLRPLPGRATMHVGIRA